MIRAAPGHAPPAPFPVERDATTPSGYRVDIQLMRALAILLVMAHHAGVASLPGGFLGVDIFFVISGFLMTGIVARELDEGRFRFGRFYARRARRLLPAAYCTLAATAIAAPFCLDAYEYRDFFQQLVASFTFVANIVLWKLTDYFDTQAAAKPLLHMWSLAVEEQYYLLFPVALVLCPARWRLPLTALAAVVSFALAAALLGRSAITVFYMLPFRAWELAIGAALALAVRSGRIVGRPMIAARCVAAAVLLALPLLFDERNHPGWPALAACLATALLLVPGGDIAQSRWTKPFTAIGDRSYSLYLLHWPLLAFANNIWLTQPPAAVRTALVVATFLAAELQYRAVEQPLRRMAVDRRTLTVLIGFPLAVIAASYAWQARHPADADSSRAYNLGISPACNLKGAFAFQPACRTGAAPRMLIWGDSFAMHVAGGIAASADVPVAQATRTVCAPFLDIAPVSATNSRDWGKRCIAFNASVIDALKRAPQVETVVLSSAFTQYVVGAAPHWQVLVHGAAGGERVVPQDNERLIQSLAQTVAALRGMGKRVVLVAPPPTAGFDIGRCLSRLQQGKPILPAGADCTFPLEAYRAYRAPTLRVLAEIERRGIVPIFRFEHALCGGGTCRTAYRGTHLYRDGDHLSVPGSIVLGRRLDLARRLDAMAR